MKRLKQGAAALTGVLLLLSGCSGGVMNTNVCIRRPGLWCSSLWRAQGR